MSGERKSGMTRREFLAASAAVTLTPVAFAASKSAEGERQLIDKVKPYAVVEPLFEGVRLVVNALGESYSADYVQGIAGAAFRIAGPCPCAPTCSSQMSTQDLLKVLGYSYREFPIGWDKTDEEYAKNTAEMVERVKRSVREGRPALVWHAFTNAEWDVVAGYDDAKGTFLGRGSYRGLKEFAEAPQGRAREALSICPAYGAIVVGAKTGKLDAPVAERTALKEAIFHARDTRTDSGGPPAQGLRAYDEWVSGFKKADRKRGNGDSYCIGVYRSTHRAAAGFLKGLKGKYRKAASDLDLGASAFAAEADALDKAAALIGWDSPESSAERNAKVWPILAEAREAYARGIDRIEKALPSMV